MSTPITAGVVGCVKQHRIPYEIQNNNNNKYVFKNMVFSCLTCVNSRGTSQYETPELQILSLVL